MMTDRVKPEDLPIIPRPIQEADDLRAMTWRPMMLEPTPYWGVIDADPRNTRLCRLIEKMEAGAATDLEIIEAVNICGEISVERAESLPEELKQLAADAMGRYLADHRELEPGTSARLKDELDRWIAMWGVG